MEKQMKFETDVLLQKEFRKEIVKSEKLRMWILTIFFASFVILSFLLVLFKVSLPERNWFFIFPSIGFFMEIIGLIIISKINIKNNFAFNFFRIISTIIESTLPILILFIISISKTNPNVLSEPPSYAIFIYIILTSLRLDMKLCIVSGAIVSVGYVIFSNYIISEYIKLTQETVEFFPHMAKALLFLGAGIITGVVTNYIKKRTVSSFKNVQEKEEIKAVFGQHVSPEVVDELITKKEEDISSQMREVTIMFLDIRNFTNFAGERTPNQVFDYLNSLFEFMIEIINKKHGIINKFLGDGFMAIFGAPIKSDNDCQNAVSAGKEIIEKINKEQKRGNIPQTRIGIGIHTGLSATGSVGSSLRKEYTIIGDVVNLASRIEQINKKYDTQILISEKVLNNLDKTKFSNWVQIDNVMVKGYSEAMKLYKMS